MLNLSIYNMKIAILSCFSDNNYVKGTTNGGIKSEFSYLTQLFMLYFSIKDNWKFNYDFYAVYKNKLKDKTLKIFKQFPDIKLKQVQSDFNVLKIEAYKLDIDCHYKLLLDCDTIALKEPNFNFNYDAQCMYGDFNYQFINNSLPNELNYLLNRLEKYEEHKINKINNNNLWNNKNENLIRQFYENKELKKFFPVFNGGAVLIKNNLGKDLGNILNNYRYFTKNENTQNILGIALNYITNNNWFPFEKGFNYPINEKNSNYNFMLKQIEKYEPILLHYINISKNNKLYNKYIKKYYSKVNNIFSQF